MSSTHGTFSDLVTGILANDRREKPVETPATPKRDTARTHPQMENFKATPGSRTMLSNLLHAIDTLTDAERQFVLGYCVCLNSDGWQVNEHLGLVIERPTNVVQFPLCSDHFMSFDSLEQMVNDPLSPRARFFI